MKSFLIKLLLKKYKPQLVVIFGNYGYIEAREAINVVLSAHTTTFAAEASDFFSNLYKKLGIFGLFNALIFMRAFPHICVINTQPQNKDYRELKNILGIGLAVVMPLGDIPSFSDVYAGPSDDTAAILDEIKSAQSVLLNGDDETVRALGDDLNGPLKVFGLKTFGYDEHADIKIISSNNFFTITKDGIEGSTHIKIEYGGTVVPMRLMNIYGKRSSYAALAALGAAVRYEVNFVNAAEDLQKYKAPFSSLILRQGIKNTALFVHSELVSPFSAREAVELLAGIHDTGQLPRIIFIFGDILMRKKGEAEGLHRTLGEMAARHATFMFLAGERVIFIEEAAIKHGMLADNIFRFDTAQEAARAAQDKLEKNDGVLILGSREMNMEEALEELKEQ